jgi:hypothetical protein
MLLKSLFDQYKYYRRSATPAQLTPKESEIRTQYNHITELVNTAKNTANVEQLQKVSRN